MNDSEPNYKKFLERNLTDLQLKTVKEQAEKGNIHAQFNVLLHNQGILNHKLNKLLNLHEQQQ